MSNFMSAADVAKELGVGRTKSQQIVKELNAEKEKMGYITVQGKIRRKFLEKRYIYHEE